MTTPLGGEGEQKMNSQPNFDYECALTGIVSESGFPDDCDGLGDLPVGWTRIHLVRRQYNPKWLLIQQVKQNMIEALLQQVPEDLHSSQQYVIGLQVEAQFHSLEEQTPVYLPDVEDVVYISDSGEILGALNEIRSSLALESLPEHPEEEEEEAPQIPTDEGEDGEEEGEEEQT